MTLILRGVLAFKREEVPLVGPEEQKKRIRKRLAELWKVKPYRIEVYLDANRVAVSLDNQKPNEELMKLFEDDLRAHQANKRREMN